MEILVALIGLVFVGAIVMGAIAIATLMAKAAFYVVLLPLKLLFLPFVVFLFVLKVVAIVAAISVVVTVIVPLAIIFGLIAAPFAIVAALA